MMLAIKVCKQEKIAAGYFMILVTIIVDTTT